MYSISSFAVFALSGRFTISVFFRMPAAIQSSIAFLEYLRLYALSASGIPGISCSATSSTAFGAQSCSKYPVAPVVMISSTEPESASWRKLSPQLLYLLAKLSQLSLPACFVQAYASKPLLPHFFLCFITFCIDRKYCCSHCFVTPFICFSLSVLIICFPFCTNNKSPIRL